MKTVILKLTSAIAIAGNVLRAGELVEVTKSEALDLLQRGRAVVAERDEVEAEDEDDVEVESDVIASATVEDPIDATVQVGDQVVDVKIVGQAEDGSPVVTDESAAALEAAAKADAEAKPSKNAKVKR